jgi:hypothetical protein
MNSEKPLTNQLTKSDLHLENTLVLQSFEFSLFLADIHSAWII